MQQVMVSHHLSDDTLVEYAAGALAAGWSLAVAAHLTLCPTCRARLQALETIGGAALEGIPPVELSAGALDRCMALVETAPPEKPDPPEPPTNLAHAGPTVLPTPLRRYVGGDVDCVRWRRIGGGVRQFILPVEGPAKARLLRIPPGAAVPEHGHRGQEMTLVFAGSFSDGEAVFGRGDIQQSDAEIEHTPTSGPDVDCICLAVTDAPLRFAALVPRLFQRFASI